MDIMQIEARPREVRGSRACRRLRTLGLVPAVLYGRQRENVLLSVGRRDLEKLIHARAVIVQVNWDGQQDAAQVREVQYDTLGERVEHVDFLRISLTEKVTVSVRVETHGLAAGVTQGGVLDLREHELEVQCLPTAIPERLRVEVSALAIGDALRVREMQFPEGVTPTADPDLVVVAVVQPTEVTPEAAEAAPAEAITEPEVIGRKEAAEEAESEGEE